MKKHKLVSLITSLAVTVTVFTALPAAHVSALYSGSNWDFNANTGVLTLSSNDAVSFSSYDNPSFQIHDVISVVCTDDVTEISENAFSGFTNLETVSMPKVTEIGANAFNNCSSLTEVEMPEVTTIGVAAFCLCSNLTRATMPKASLIGYSAFAYCNKLTVATMPEAVEIKGGAFDGCTLLTTVEMPKVEIISSIAFRDCSALVGAEMPEVTSISSSAFIRCTSLEEASMPKATSIGASAFEKCTSLEEASMPKATSIGASAFAECTSLTTVSIPKVFSIAERAFYDCERLTDITIPSSLRTMGNNVFRECSALNNIRFLGNIPTQCDTYFCTNCTAVTCTVPYGSDLTAWAAAFNNPSNVTFVAAPAPNHTITATAGAGGSISPSGAVSVDNGESKTFTIAANNGYSIASVTVDGVNQGAISSYTFANVTSDHTIWAAFSCSDNPNVKSYHFIRGINAKWDGGSDGLEFTADGNADDLVRVEVDNKIVAPADYDVKSGSTIVTLKPEYLKTLSAGRLLLTLVYKDNSCSAYFTTTSTGTTEADAGDNIGSETIEDLPKPQENENPPTGNSLTGISAVTLLSLAAAGIIIKKRRK